MNFFAKSVSVDINRDAISLVHPSVIKLAATIQEPTAMYGLLRPHLDVLESAKAPTIGCTIRPDRGPAIQTKDVWLLVKPRFNKYGVQSVILEINSQRICRRRRRD